MSAPPRQPAWQLFDHGADIGIRGYGDTPSAAFVQAATAMTAVITDPALVAPESPVNIQCKAQSLDLLFVDWLNALVYEMATRKMLFSRFDISIHGDSLQATAWGEAVETGRHHPAVEIKGATYTALEVGKNKDGKWLAQCVVDV